MSDRDLVALLLYGALCWRVGRLSSAQMGRVLWAAWCTALALVLLR